MSDETRYPGIDAETFIRWGKEAAEAGNKRRAYSYFSQALRLRAEDEEAWLWKGAMAEDPQESLECMRKALSINPKSRQAWQGLEWAAAKLAQERGQVPVPEMAQPSPTPPPAEAEVESAPAIPSTVDIPEEEPVVLEWEEGEGGWREKIEGIWREKVGEGWRERIEERWGEKIGERWPLIAMAAVSVAILVAFYLLLRALGS